MSHLKYPLALSMLLAACLVPHRLVAQEPDSAAVAHLRRALQTSYATPSERTRTLEQCLAQLHSLADLRAAATLTEWEASRDDEVVAPIDGAARSRARQRFESAVRQLLRRGEVSSASATLTMLRDMAERGRSVGEPLALLHGFAADVADVALRGAPPLRPLAAAALADIEPPVYLAVPVLSELLHADNVELRRAAAAAFAQWLRNGSRQSSAAGLRLRPAQRAELVLTASSVLPAIHDGLDDAEPEIRRRCLETIALACTALTRLLDDASVNDDAATRRTPQAEFEELHPLLLALREQGPILERFIHDDDLPTRLLTHKALEELAVARGRWQSRWTGEKLLSELLCQTLPSVAEELAHPDARVRRGALDVLEMSGSLALPALPALTRALHDPDRFVRWSAVRTVGKLGPAAAPETRDELKRLLHDPDGDLRKAAAHALERLHSTDSPSSAPH
jgi:HEAT repeat protein